MKRCPSDPAGFLTRSEEQRLARLARAGDEAARARLVLSHLRMVARMARRYRSSGLPFADLVQEGTVGLIQAVRRFDPDRETRLSTVALWWVRAALQDYAQRSWSMVRLGTSATQRSLFLALRRLAAERWPEEDLGAAATSLAQRFNLSVGEVMTAFYRVVGRDQSLDDAHPAGGRAALIEALADPGPTPEELAIDEGARRLAASLLGRAIGCLPPREAAIIRGRYFADPRATFAGLGRELGLSKDRVRQLEARAIAELRARLAVYRQEFGLLGGS